MKLRELTKEVKTQIETFTYEGIDEAIKLAEEHGTVEFFDKLLGELQLRCERYNQNHVCTEAKFFNRGLQVKAQHFAYRALIGLVNIACKGSKAYEFRNNTKEIVLYGHIWEGGITFGGNIDLKYISNFNSLTEIHISDVGSISNLDLINNFKNLKKLLIEGITGDWPIPFSLRNMPFISNKLLISPIKLELPLLEELELRQIEDIDDLRFLAGSNNLRKIVIINCKINALAGIPTSIEKLRYDDIKMQQPIKNSEFEHFRNLKKLNYLEISSLNSDFSFLEDLTELVELNINCKAEKIIIPDLSKQNKLRDIRIPEPTENLDFLNKNQSIEMVSINNTKITNIKGLGSCNKIKVITIDHCSKLTNLSGLENCKELDIKLNNVGIENLDALNKCIRLSKFGTRIIEDFDKSSFSSTEVETFSDGTNDLDYVIRKNTLYISGCNNLTVISGIKNATNLMGLSITNCNKLKKIEGIESLKNIYEIDFSNCTELEDISIIKNFPLLRRLNITGCKNLKVKNKQWIFESLNEVEEYKSTL